MENKKTYTISIYTENNVGILNRLSAIFLKRHINIESLIVSESEIDHVHKFTFVVNITETLAKKLIGQIEKQIEVLRAFYHTDEEVIYQENALFKISTHHLYDEKIQKKLKLRRARIVMITKEYFVISASGSKEDIDNMYLRLKPYGLLQFVRSGRISISRARMEVSKLVSNR